jgi:hypothetical protein
MNDLLVLYSGMFCFGMIGLGVGLTIYEFKKMAHLQEKSIRERAQTKPSLAIGTERLKQAL